MIRARWRCVGFVGLSLITGLSALVHGQEHESRWHEPLTLEKAGGEFVAPWWVEPAPPGLPSDNDLVTTLVQGRTYNIVRVAQGATHHPLKSTLAVPVKVRADAAVSQAKPAENFGKWGRSPVRGGSDARYFLLAFELPENPGPWIKAELSVKVHSLDAKEPVTLRVLALEDSPWEETSVCWNNQPARVGNMSLAQATADQSGQVVIFDLTEPIRQRPRGTASLALAIITDAGKQVTLQSKELSGGYTPVIRLWSQTSLDAAAELAPPPDPLAARALYEAEDQTLYFKGSGRGGRESKERLIIEDCTFIVDFQHGDFTKWDALRSAVYVEGYREVIVRRSTFISRGKYEDPPRKTNASFTAYDCEHVLVEDCTFEGLTNWMRGHVLVYCCGPTTIRRVEIKGCRQHITDKSGQVREVFASGGGIWVANGMGESKIGSLHANEADLRMYPSGPLVIEDCHVHHQTGRENNDGIYIQSIHPFVVRNPTVEHWKTDALMDLGFRDSLGKSFSKVKLANHGAMGLVENCRFAGGYLKVSVGAGGGIVMRNNVFEDVYLMPYVFDGGHWYVLNNRFEKVTGPVISGRDGRTTGWAPKEGMFMRGSQMIWRNNPIHFANDKGVNKLVVLNPHGPKDYPPINADDPRLSDQRDDTPLQLLPQRLQPDSQP